MSLFIICCIIDSQVDANPKQGVEWYVSFERLRRLFAFPFLLPISASSSRFALVSSLPRSRWFKGEGPVEEAAETW